MSEEIEVGKLSEVEEGKMFEGEEGKFSEEVEEKTSEGNKGKMSEGEEGKMSEGEEGKMSEGEEGKMSEGEEGKMSEGDEGKMSEGDEGKMSEGKEGKMSEGKEGKYSKESVEGKMSEKRDEGKMSEERDEGKMSEEAEEGIFYEKDGVCGTLTVTVDDLPIFSFPFFKKVKLELIHGEPQVEDKEDSISGLGFNVQLRDNTDIKTEDVETTDNGVEEQVEKEDDYVEQQVEDTNNKDEARDTPSEAFSQKNYSVAKNLHCDPLTDTKKSEKVNGQMTIKQIQVNTDLKDLLSMTQTSTHNSSLKRACMHLRSDSNKGGKRLKTSQPSIVMNTSQPSIILNTNKPSIVLNTNKPSIVLNTNKPSIVLNTGEPSIVLNTNEPSIVLKRDEASIDVDEMKTPEMFEENSAEDILEADQSSNFEVKVSFPKSKKKAKQIKQSKLYSGKVKCSFCKTIFDNKFAFLEHRQIYVDGPHGCSQCDKTFSYKSFKSRHEVQVHGSESSSTDCWSEDSQSFKCDQCGDSSFKTFTNLANHLTYFHNEEFVHKCCVCERVTKRNGCLKKHMMGQHSGGEKKTYDAVLIETQDKRVKKEIKEEYPGGTEDGQVTCEHCQQVFGSKSALADHRKVFLEGPHACSVCEKTFSYKAFKTVHEHIIHKIPHLPDVENRYYECDICGNRKSQSLARLAMHLNHNHSKEFIYQCCICGKTMRVHDYWHKHVAMHKKGESKKCHCCDKIFPSVKALFRHRLATVEIKCHFCGEIFPNNTSRNQHYTAIHSTEVIRCTKDKCFRMFSRQEDFERHLEGHVRFKKQQCKTCGLFFSRLEKHVLTHERPAQDLYMCDQCPYSTSNDNCLRTHRAKHHSTEKVYQCPYCPETFTECGRLRKHLSKHVLPGTYKCEVCGKSFKEAGRLRRHQQSHEGGEELSCPVCSQTFVDISSLETHIKDEHSHCEGSFTVEYIIEGAEDGQTLIQSELEEVYEAAQHLHSIAMMETKPSTSTLPLS